MFSTATAAAPTASSRKRGRPRGHRQTADAKRAIDAIRKTKLWLSVLTAAVDHLLLLLTIAAAELAWRQGLGLLLAVFSPLLWLVAIRAQRGLEALVHEGSHFNFSRRHSLNDAVVNLLAGLPVFSTVTLFRAPHLDHHLRFGTDEDPCHHRFAVFGWEDVLRQPSEYLRHMARHIAPYSWGWWAQVGTNLRTLVGALLWHAIVLLAPLMWLFGVRGLVWWALYWFAPFVIALPWLRFIAESEKHKYQGTGTVFEATISSVGFIHRLLVHPHGDGYHLLHHLDPTIPHHALARAHRLLLKIDPEYRAGHRHRTHIFESFRVGEAPSIEELYPELLSDIDLEEKED